MNSFIRGLSGFLKGIHYKVERSFHMGLMFLSWKSYAYLFRRCDFCNDLKHYSLVNIIGQGHQICNECFKDFSH